LRNLGHWNVHKGIQAQVRHVMDGLQQARFGHKKEVSVYEYEGHKIAIRCYTIELVLCVPALMNGSWYDLASTVFLIIILRRQP
jgi:hypothetical protein